MNRLIPTPFTLSVFAAIVIAFTAWRIYHMLHGKNLQETTPETQQSVRNRMKIHVAVISAALLTLLFTGTLYTDGSARGMTFIQWKSMDIGTIINTSGKTPRSDRLPKQMNGHVVILYKYGCPDCEAIWPDLKQAVSDTGLQNVHYIASSSDAGQRIIQQTHIDDVPALVYMRHKPLANGATTTHMSAYKQIGNDISVNEAALKRVKLLQEKKR